MAGEEKNQAATAEPLNASIELVDYNPAWVMMFERAAASVRAALRERVLLLEHVGSTSVPGLAAKPVIDTLLVVADSADEAAYVPPIEALGYVLRIREPEWYEHRMLKGRGAASNLHVLSRGCPEIDRMLLFRDWLRNNEADRFLYERVKRDLSGRRWEYTQNYADAKTAVVEEIMARALAASSRP